MIVINMEKQTNIPFLNIVKGDKYDTYEITLSDQGLFEVSKEEWKFIQTLNTEPVER